MRLQIAPTRTNWYKRRAVFIRHIPEIAMTRRPLPVALPLLIALLCAAMLGGALLTQFWLGWEPCTLCVQIRLWLSVAAAAALLLALAGATKQAWLAVLLWPVLLAAGGMAVFDNAHVVLIETGLMDSFSCSPFPFYSDYLPLHEYWPDVFMSGGICGQNDYFIFGIPFTGWTLAAVTALFMLILVTLWRSIRRAR